MALRETERPIWNGVLERAEQEAVQRLRDQADGKLKLSNENKRDAIQTAMLGFLCRSSAESHVLLCDINKSTIEVRDLAEDSNRQIRELRSNPLLKFFRDHPKLTTTSAMLVTASATTAAILRAFGVI